MKQNNINQQLIKESIFIIGSVSSVSWRSVKIKVNKNKNASHLLYNGQVLKNISVNSYIKISKWFTNIIWKVEWEYVEIKKVYNKEYNKEEDLIERYLQVSLFGHFEWEKFQQWIKEMPLVDNECYLLDREEFEALHKFNKDWEKTINIWVLTEEPAQEIKVSINALFASHIWVFWNTWSWKSNTLARIYYELFKTMESNSKFQSNSKFIIIDFNWEYWKDWDEIITKDKKVYNLSTRKEKWEDQIPLNEKDLIDLELISILANATEKTQKPFIERTINFYKKIHKKDELPSKSIDNQILDHFRNSLKLKLKDIFSLTVKDRAYTLLEYIKLLLDFQDKDWSDYDWSNTLSYFFTKSEWHNNWKITDNQISNLKLFKKIDDYEFPKDSISKFIHFLYLQIVFDIYNDKAQNDHISPAINKLRSRQKDIAKIFKTEWNTKIFDEDKNLIVINLKDTNTETKKTIPLLLSKKLYEEHKEEKNDFKNKSLHIIIDEAHNILSDSSERESRDWKDYRLETFEEIIKEWRKFNVFLTIASQRPSDISATIISQLHNYFIHKLINDFDINAIHKTVAYLDKLSFESIPILSTWSCFFAWLATNLPVKVNIKELDEINKPDSWTVTLEDIWKD